MGLGKLVYKVWLSGSGEGSGCRDELSFLGPRRAEVGCLRECLVPREAVKEKPQLLAVALTLERPRLHQVSSLPSPTLKFVCDCDHCPTGCEVASPVSESTMPN